jgi:putative hemolysin
MSTIIPEILFILALILANGLLAMSEFAVVSSRKARLRQCFEAGSNKARAALAEAPGHFLSAIQIGITLVGILAGVYSGITIAEQLAARLSQVARLASYSQPLALSIVVLSLTFFTLVIGELVPRRIALHSPERILRLARSG